MVSTLELELALPFSLISSSFWRLDPMTNASDFLHSFEGNWLIFVMVQFFRKCKLHLESRSLDILLAVPISWANSTSFILVVFSQFACVYVTLIWIVHFSSKCWQIISNLYPFQDIPIFFICSVFFTKPNLLSHSPFLSRFHSKFILHSKFSIWWLSRSPFFLHSFVHFPKMSFSSCPTTSSISTIFSCFVWKTFSVNILADFLNCKIFTENTSFISRSLLSFCRFFNSEINEVKSRVKYFSA